MPYRCLVQQLSAPAARVSGPQPRPARTARFTKSAPPRLRRTRLGRHSLGHPMPSNPPLPRSAPPFRPPHQSCTTLPSLPRPAPPCSAPSAATATIVLAPPRHRASARGPTHPELGSCVPSLRARKPILATCLHLREYDRAPHIIHANAGSWPPSRPHQASTFISRCHVFLIPTLVSLNAAWATGSALYHASYTS